MATDYEISDLSEMHPGVIYSLKHRNQGQKLRVQYLGPGAQSGSIKVKILSTGYVMEFKDVLEKFDITWSSRDPDKYGNVVLGGSKKRAYGRKRKTRCKKSSKRRRCRKSSRRRR